MLARNGRLVRDVLITGLISMSIEQRTLAAALTIPRKATIEGGIIFPGPVVVDGTLIGDLRCMSVIISERGIVDGAILAESVTVMGEVTGEIFAVSLTLKAACSVSGDIFHRHLALEDGCYFEGKSRRHKEPLSLAS
jgi:cytoskeletal protein CcmA (bactofilin family)